MDQIVDVYDRDGAQVGAYTITLHGPFNQEDFELKAIRCAIEDGDAAEEDKVTLKAKLREARPL